MRRPRSGDKNVDMASVVGVAQPSINVRALAANVDAHISVIEQVNARLVVFPLQLGQRCNAGGEVRPVLAVVSDSVRADGSAWRASSRR